MKFKIMIMVLAAFLLLTMNGFCDENSLMVDENGNVGIGTAEPLRALHVKSAAGTAQIESTGNSGTLYFGDIGSSNVDNQGIGSRGEYMGIMAGGYDRLTVLPSGNVGIGTTTPEAKLEIKVESTSQIVDETKDFNGNYIVIAGGVGYLNEKTAYAAKFIGNHANGIESGMVLGREKSAWGTYVAFHTHPNDAAALDSFQERMRVNSDGNVGIGTTSPSYKLDVVGTIRGSNVSPSDARWKTNISTIDNALEKVASLRGVSYEWIDPAKGMGDQIGVIAQEVEDIFPEAVSTDNQGYKSVAYAKLVSPLIEAVKTLKAENEQLKQRNEDIIDQLAEIKAILHKLQ